MALPKLDQPTFTLTVPTTGKQLRYRPFTVREEKILLVAQQSGEVQDFIDSFKQIITNCVVDELDIDKMSSVDIEYIFLNLRAKSVSNVVEMKVLDKHKKQIDVSINLDNVQCHKSAVSKNVVLDEERNIGIKMKYPSFAELEKLSTRDEGKFDLEQGMELIMDMIEFVWHGEDVTPTTDVTRSELSEFLQDINASQMSSINEFLTDLPYVYLDMEFKNSEGEVETRRIAGLRSFFG